MDAFGSFVVAWEGNGLGDDSGIFARRYDPAGTPNGIEFRVNQVTTNVQTDAAVAMETSGDFVVTWASFGQDGSDFGVYAKPFHAGGTPQQSEFRVNTTTASNQRAPSVATDDDGDAVIAWQGPDSSGYGVYAQRYVQDGPPPSGPDRLVNNNAGAVANGNFTQAGAVLVAFG